MNFQSVVRRTAYGVRRVFLLGTPVAVLCAIFLCGCARVTGGAGYWHTNPEGGITAKQGGFDTNNLVQKGKTPGSIAI